MTQPLTVLAFSGSLRRASWNTGLIREAISLAPTNMTITLADYTTIPFFNQDLESKVPEPVLTLRAQIHAADAFLFALPEYNYSIPGVFKNMIDWISRDRPLNGFAGKVGAVMGAGGRVGTARGQLHFRQIATSPLGMILVPRPEVLVIQAAEKFDADGNLTDAAVRQQVSDLLKNLGELAGKLRA